MSALFIGIMSGTSLDGVDVALCRFDANFKLIATQFLPYPTDLKIALLALHEPSDNELETSILLGNRLASLYAEAVNKLLDANDLSANTITAIGCHGQTIRHRPELKFTLQIGNNALLAELTNIMVVGDFRSRDIAAGGQGAPLVPAFHQAIFGSKNVNRAIVNIGGIANITVLTKNGNHLNSGQVLGFDTGPGNMLLDSWAKLRLGKDFDANGDWAATGVVLDSLLSGMLAEPYFALPPPKSTGRDLFNDHWLKQHLLYPHLRSQDVARTLVALTAHTIHNAIAQDCGQIDEVYLCGGGARNTLLVNSLKEMLHGRLLATTEDLGVGVDWVEAVAFAWLAKQTIDNKPSNLPSVTGAKGARVLGAIYPK
ncbi:MAG: anhydro-N-acetylmuramic acid kinase [Bdellovibrio sp.]|nr:anhydro-N-acetylmuramic acid kinase [Methylotenera sp.]